MFFSNSVGFKISGTDLRVGVIKNVFGKLRLSATDTVAGFLDMDEDQRRRAVLDLTRKHKIGAGRVYLSIPRDNGVVRQIEFPIEVRDKLREAVTFQMETLSPWPTDEIYSDYSAGVPKSTSKTIPVTVVIIPRAVLDPWITFFKSAGLPLSGASLSSLVCAHGTSVLWPDTRPTVVLDCEDSFVEGVIIQASRVTSLTVKGSDVNAQARSVAEQLMSVGRVQSPENVRVVLHGSASSAFETIPTVPLPLENARSDSSRVFGTIAAALAGIKRSAFNVNLVPADQRYRRNQLQLIPTYALVGLTVLAGIAMIVREPYQSSVYASKLDTEIRKISPEIKEVSAQEAELNRLSEKYRALFGHFQSRDLNLEAMRELSHVLPPTAWLTNYIYQNDSVTISGFAQSASEIQKALEDSPVFKDVQFVNSVTRDANGKDRFSVKATLEGTK